MRKTLALLWILLLLISGCGPKSTRISYDILAEPENLDPQSATDQASLMVINNTLEGLYTFDETGNPVPAAAKEMTKSEDGLHYRCTLRDTISWENGESVTAYDFVFAFRRMFRSDTASPGALQFRFIKNAQAVLEKQMEESALGVTALSDKILEFELESENDAFEYLLASTYAMPCNEKFFNETKGKYGLEPEQTLANGPYLVSTWFRGDYIALRKNTKYWDQENVKPDSLLLNIDIGEEDPAQRLLAGETGASWVSGKDIGLFSGQGYSMEQREFATIGLVFNMKTEVFQESLVRKGIAGVFDRESYREILPVNLTMAEAVVPPSAVLYGKTFREYGTASVVPPFDPTTALEQYKEGLRLLDAPQPDVLKLIVNKDKIGDFQEYFGYPSQILQKELSLYINIEELEEEEYNKRLGEGEYDLAAVRLTAGDNSPSGILSQFKSDSPQNLWGHQNSAFDNLVNLAMLGDSREAVVADLMKAEQILSQEAIFIPVAYEIDFFVESPDLTGIRFHRNTGLISFRYAYSE